MVHPNVPLETLVRYTDRMVKDCLYLWDLPAGVQIQRINVSENVTYLMEAKAGFKAVLRVHRHGYHTKRAIECELEWIKALEEAGDVIVPRYFTGLDGKIIQTGRIPELAQTHFLVLFQFLEGEAPRENTDLVAWFATLGRLAAKTHIHSKQWERREPFVRHTWDIDTIFGENAIWGNWRDAPGVNEKIRPTLEAVERIVCERLLDYGKSADRYGLIHADMRLANLLVDETGTKLIDFDDCGFGWFLYDFAAAISFMEDDVRVPLWKKAWLSGYRTIQPLSSYDEDEMDTFVMLRRMALLAWVGSHIEAPEPQALAPDFAANTAKIGSRWLHKLKIGHS